MIEPRVGSLVHVPYDQQIRTYGLRDVTRLGSRSLQAADQLARAVLSSAHASWGDPLPVAATPAALPLPIQLAQPVPEKVSP